MTKLSGSCMCGAVAFEATPQVMEMYACHCEMCRKWAGGISLAVPCSDLNFEEKSALGVFKSSDWGERLFCKQCGTSLAWQMQDGSEISVSAQAFSDADKFEFSREIYFDCKPSNYGFSNDTTKLTEAEIVAAFASGDVEKEAKA